ncbi:MAG: cell division ATP-binding protein FtsE [Candidatus Kerfeldbacteria bacterium]|nr:cell division ATP-binding protein FtsE [Candidatus Kerfeldbacteria bacterium]
MITFENVTKLYGSETVALSEINLNIDAGEFVSIVGQSGSGKTTLIRLMIAQEEVSEGRIEIGGWDISHLQRGDIPVLRRQIGVVFQDFKLLPKKTVFENVAFALEVCGATGKRIKKIVPQVLKIVGLEGKADRFPHQLSGGEQQRVVIARSLVHRPKVLVADEPTGNLDTITTHEIIDLLLKINSFGTTLILVTHDPSVVNRLRKRVITLDHGAVVSDQKSGKYTL